MQSETWRKEKMYGEKDTVLWAILTGKGIENIRVVGSALREEDADAIIAAHTAASTLRTELEAYKKAWELPEQPVTQGVVPSAGEVAANAVEEARIYRDQRDALRTALTEALADIEAGIKDDTLPPQYVLGLAYAMGRLTDPRIPALAALHTPTGAGTAEAN